MPELPEVETIRRGLEKYVVGYTIEDVEVRLPKMEKEIGEIEVIRGGTVQRVRRFGKGLLIDLDNGYSLAVHVKMTGQLLFRKVSKGDSPIGDLPSKHTHVVFKLLRHPELVSGSTTRRNEMLKPVQHDGTFAYLYFNDQRQFGWIKIVKTAEVVKMPFFKALGPEPLNNLTLQQCNNILQSTKSPIKQVLMDQTKIAGIGNIYANDALYLAKIHPKRPANSLSSAETKELFAAIETVLRKGIEAGGASEWHYVDVLGGKGQYQNFFLVYGKAGKPCQRCGTIIKKMKLVLPSTTVSLYPPP